MLIRSIPFALLCFLPLFAQEPGSFEMDILGSYYDQDGENSPVNGGIGSEELSSASPIIVLRYATEKWLFSANLGFDNVTSASIDAMDDNRPAGLVLPESEYDEEDYENGYNVSSASRMDNRAFAIFSASRAFGNNNITFSAGFSKEYDYTSVNGGIGWSRNFNGNNTTLGVNLHHYQDSIDLYNIHGINEGSDDRTTTDFSISMSHIFTPKAAGSIELFASDQSGFLSSPFQEVILDDGTHVTERLPDNRLRTGVRLALNYAWTERLIHRNSLRYYDDDFGIDALTLEQELHFRVSESTWIYPIVRFHQQGGSDYFGLPRTFTATDTYYTADRDLSEFDSTKLGLGASWSRDGRFLKGIDVRLTYYDRDDGLNSFNISFGTRWSFR